MVIDPTLTKKWLRTKADKIVVNVTEQCKEWSTDPAKACLLKADYGKDSSAGWTRSLEQIPVFTTREISSYFEESNKSVSKSSPTIGKKV